MFKRYCSVSILQNRIHSLIVDVALIVSSYTNLNHQNRLCFLFSTKVRRRTTSFSPFVIESAINGFFPNGDASNFAAGISLSLQNDAMKTLEPSSKLKSCLHYVDRPNDEKAFSQNAQTLCNLCKSVDGQKGNGKQLQCSKH